MSIPRPPRPPRPGMSTQPTAPAPTAPVAAKNASGLQSGGSAKAGGDTRTVVLSRKNMGMQQTKKEDPVANGAPGAASSSYSPAAAAQAGRPAQAVPPPVQPQLPRAKVTHGHVSCVGCSTTFPIIADEYYGAIVECPDCAAEFVIPSKAEVGVHAHDYDGSAEESAEEEEAPVTPVRRQQPITTPASPSATGRRPAATGNRASRPVQAPAPSGGAPMGLIIGGGVVLLILIGVVVFLVTK